MGRKKGFQPGQSSRSNIIITTFLIIAFICNVSLQLNLHLHLHHCFSFTLSWTGRIFVFCLNPHHWPCFPSFPIIICIHLWRPKKAKINPLHLHLLNLPPNSVTGAFIYNVSSLVEPFSGSNVEDASLVFQSVPHALLYPSSCLHHRPHQDLHGVRLPLTMPPGPLHPFPTVVVIHHHQSKQSN